MKEILNNRSTQDVLKLLMVGGFSECHMLQDAIRKNFPNKQIIIPEEASMSVLKGAVLFGHRPDYVQTRVMRCSYGIKTNVPFDERKHDAKHRVNMDGEERCDNIFSLIVEKDQQVDAGTVIKRSYVTPYRNQEVMEFMVYTSTNRFPVYIDDESCTLLCKPTITFPDTCKEKRWVDVEYTFGNTEIGLKAVDRTSGNEITANLHLI